MFTKILFAVDHQYLVGWVKRSETQQMPVNVGFRSSTQPTKIKLILFTIRGAVEPILFAVDHQCKLKALTNRIRGYTGQVRLRGLIKNQGFETHAGGFCLCRRDF